MRVFRYWLKEPRQARCRDFTVAGWVHGGSNLSLEDARADLEQRWAHVIEPLARGERPDTRDYEADIREEVLELVSPDLAITRNRYGAEILNCRSPILVDIDWQPLTFFERLLGKTRLDSAERTRRVMAHLHKLVLSGSEGIRGIRAYQTPAGMRAVVHGPEPDPRSDQTRRVMKALKADGLYAALCRKQNCFRARLTPKPSRIGLKSLKQAWPVDPADLPAREQWVAAYRQKAPQFAACAYLETLGTVPSSTAIEWHDDRSGALRRLPLA